MLSFRNQDNYILLILGYGTTIPKLLESLSIPKILEIKLSIPKILETRTIPKILEICCQFLKF